VPDYSQIFFLIQPLFLKIVENVPARVNDETGEQFFSPSTVMILDLSSSSMNIFSRLLPLSMMW